jgi:hypothetical protein
MRNAKNLKTLNFWGLNKEQREVKLEKRKSLLRVKTLVKKDKTNGKRECNDWF